MKNKHFAIVALVMAASLFLPLAANANEFWFFWGNQAPFNDPFPPGTSPAIPVGAGPVTVTNANGFKVTLTPYSIAPTDAGATNGTVGQLTGRNLGPGSDEQGAGVGPGPYTDPPSTSFEVNGTEAIRIDFTDFSIIPGAASIHLFFNSLTPSATIETAHIWQDSTGAGGTSLGTIVHNPATFPAPEDFSIPASAFGHPIFVTSDAGDFLLFGVSVDTVGIGCTRTFGYWKTHSIFGPAAHPDPTWNKLPNGPNTQFFFSGKTWLEVLQTNPKGGNAYYILAHQFIAAVLNILSGASTTPTVQAAFLEAVAFFSNPANTPTTVLSSTERDHLLSLADVLDQYNEGIIGPGHCSED